MFTYSENPKDLTKKYTQPNIESFAKTFRILNERQAINNLASNSYLESSQDVAAVGDGNTSNLEHEHI